MILAAERETTAAEPDITSQKKNKKKTEVPSCKPCVAEEGIKNFIICTKESSIDITKRKNTVQVESPRVLYMVKTEILQGARRIAECTY